MKVERQELDELMARLTTVSADWLDERAGEAIAMIESLPHRDTYGAEDIRRLLDRDFDVAKLVLQLFAGLSKDSFQAELVDRVGKGKAGVSHYSKEPDALIEALLDLGLPLQMSAAVNRKPLWHDALVERLRSGRGSAITGQQRGRGMEDFVEEVVRRVVGDRFDARCNFSGQRDRLAKCDFALPDKEDPRVVMEVKAFGATGSKMTDVLGDVEKIISAKRSDTAFVFFTDGTPWFQRKNDFRKLVDYQNQGDIFRIYTRSMAEEFEHDLRTLAIEAGIPSTT